MPTGYTADVQSGKINEFRDFAMRCARAFGALITMRDEPADAPIPDRFEPEPHYAQRLQALRAELADLQAMTIDQGAVMAEKCNQEALASWKRREAERAEHRRRYEVMLAHAERWTPPTADHEEFRKFMISQLRESIEFDCGHAWPEPTPMKRDEWHAQAVAEAKRMVERYEEHVADEIDRARTRTEWVRALRESLA